MTGYESKRAAARDKLLDDDDDLTIAYLNGVYDGKKAAQPAQEPVAWADLQKEAQQIVESKFLWKKFIDGTPLSNDIACWMADFAQQYTHPPQRPWVGLTEEEIEAIYLQHYNQYEECESPNWRHERAIEAALRSKNT